ncbi:MAG: hypothetical protein ABIF10_06460 [Candidatus Woesearchaeota archaeon]
MTLVIKPPTPPDSGDSETLKLSPSKASEEHSNYLEKERSELDKKERILQMKEEAYKKELEYLDLIRHKLDDELRERRHSVEIIEKQMEERQQVLWEKERMLQEKEKILGRKQKSGQAGLEMEIRELNAKKQKLETEITKKAVTSELDKENIDTVNKALIVKEEILNEKEACLKNYEADLKKREDVKPCEEEIARLEKKRDDMDKDLQEHMARLNQSHATIEEREKQIAEIQKELAEKAEDLKKEEETVLRLKNLLLEKDQRLKDKERMLVRPSVGHEEIEAHTRILEQKKAIFDEELPLSLEKLAKIREEWQIKESLLRDKTTKILTDKKELEAVLEKIEDNARLLEQKEKEILKVVDQMEKDRRLLDSEEQRIVLKVRKLQEAEKSIKERERNIRDIERTIAKEESSLRAEIMRIDNAKEQKKEIPSLKKIHSRLLKEIQVINDEALAKRELLKAEEARLKSFELELRRKESEIQLKEKQLIEEEYVLMEHSEDDQVVLRSYVAKEPGRYSDISLMISKAKGHIAAHEIDKAYKVISQAESAVQRMEESARSQFVYEILELKTDAKLASLT